MLTGSEISIIFLVICATFGILLWGYNRSKAYGKLGILAWLQSVVLMVPWLTFFALLLLGINLNLAAILFLIIASVAVYIWLGNRLRAQGQEPIRKPKTPETPLTKVESQSTTETKAEPEPTVESPPTGEMTPISEADLKAIQSIFGIDTFFAIETISYQEGAIFKGNLRGEPDVVHQRLSQKLQDSLGERYRLFLVESPEGKPVVIVLPRSNDPKTTNLAQKNLALVLLIATIATSLESASLLLGFDFFSELGRYPEALPISLGLWIILAAHEIAHHLLARNYQIRLSIPFFLPNWQIGAFGAITRFESFVPHRKALFDVAFAGPAVGGLLSLLMMITGLLLSHPDSSFQIPTTFLQGSILVGTLTRIFLGSNLQSQLVAIHPLVIIGWLGLVITALNLLPAGQLDGGRIVQAIYGRKIARRTSIATLIILGAIALFNPTNPIPLYWLIVILFLQRELERPSLNELTEPDDTRALFALLGLFLMLATLIPLSPTLAGQLGIGN